MDEYQKLVAAATKAVEYNCQNLPTALYESILANIEYLVDYTEQEDLRQELIGLGYIEE